MGTPKSSKCLLELNVTEWEQTCFQVAYFWEVNLMLSAEDTHARITFGRITNEQLRTYKHM